MTPGRAEPPRSFLAGLIGQGIGPSLSPELHEREAARQRLRYVYKVIDLADDRTDRASLARLLASAVHLGFDGLNVTHPAKQTMVPLVDELSAEAAAIGALNTVLIRGGTTIGHNTDVTGFRRSFAEGMPGAGLDRVVLLGAGGAGTAVAHALATLGVGRLVVLDLDPARARALATSVGVHDVAVETVEPTRDGLARVLASADGVVNASPVGMAAHPGTSVPAELLRPDLWVADIVYRPLVTTLLDDARAVGCAVLSGAGMAVHQAADTFELFTGLEADRTAMFRDFDELASEEGRVARPGHTSRDDTGERNR